MNFNLSIVITLKEKLTPALKKAVAQTRLATSGIKKFGDALKKLRAPGLKGIGRALKSIGTVIAGLIGYHGLRALGRAIGDLASQVGPIQSVRIAFENFTEAARASVPEFSGTASSLLSDMRDITNGAISATDMMKSANLAFLLVGDQVATRLPQMLQTAQAAALATGQDLDYMFESLIKGVGRLSTRWLDNLGISISLTEAYADYADELNVLPEALTHTQRVTAVLNAAMAQGENIIMRMGNVSLLLSTRMASLRNSFVDTRDTILNDFAPVFSVLAQSIQHATGPILQAAEDWVTGFVDGLAQIPASTKNAAQGMGNEAAQWAMEALVWGTNVGVNFGIGIIEGFTAIFVTVMNAITALLTWAFAPGSPPNVAPQIDTWGKLTMQEWVNGLLEGSEEMDLSGITASLQAQLEGGVKPALLQMGIDAMAAWTEGLAIIDLEFLTNAVESQLDRAKKKFDALTGVMKKQRGELFRLQILNKDPTAIRNKIKEVNATQDALDEQKSEIDILEERKDLLKEQLDIMRLLLRAIRETASASSGAGGGGGGGGGGISVPELDIGAGFGAGGGLDLAERLKRIRDTFAEVSGQIQAELKRLRTSWDESTAEMGEAWAGFAEALGIDTVTSKDWADMASIFGTIIGMAGGLKLIGVLIGIIWTPIGILVTGLLGAVALMNHYGNKDLPRLSDKLTWFQKTVMNLLRFGEMFGRAIMLVPRAIVYAVARMIELVGSGINAVGRMFDEVAGRINEAFGEEVISGAGMGATWGQGYIDAAQEMRTNVDQAIMDLDVGYGDHVYALETGAAAAGEAVKGEAKAFADAFDAMGGKVHDWSKSVRKSYNEVAGTQRANHGKLQEQNAMTISDLKKQIDVYGEWEDNIKESVGEVSGTLRANHGKLRATTSATNSNLRKQQASFKEWRGVVKDQLSLVSGAIDGNHKKLDGLHGGLKNMNNFLKNTKFTVDFEWPGPPPDYLDDYGTPGPQQYRGVVPGLGGGGGTVGGKGGGGTVVNINAPLMENVMVPNMQVGRELSEQIAQDIGRMARDQKRPA